MDVYHWVEGSNHPIATERKMRACVFDITPGKRKRPAIFSDARKPYISCRNAERRVTRLHGCNNTQLLEARSVIGMDDFYVFHAMTAIPFPVQLLNGFIAIEHAPNCAITATMDKNLQ